MAGERPPREGLRLLLRASGALVFIMLATAGATATAGLLTLKEAIPTAPASQPPIVTQELEVAKPGKPQTLMILGSDRRWSDLKKNNPLLKQSNPSRSDTILLVRLDPNQEATAVLSIPRDLKVMIPGHGLDKINTAYSIGGPSLTARTVKTLLGIKIHHIINVNFSGFREAVNAVGCVYVDVDRRYYHSNAGLPVSQHYAEIDIRPGYQRLCGQRALDYVRFRHADSDIVRAARQQDFLRAAKDQISTSKLLGDRDTLIKIFNDNTQTDERLRSVSGVLKLLKLAVFSAGHPVRQIQFPAQFEGDAATGQFVVASPDAIARTADRFLHAKAAKSSAGATRLTRRAPTAKAPSVRLQDARRRGADLVAPIRARMPFPVFFPRKLTLQGQYSTTQPQPRTYTLRDRAGRPHRAYRLVVVESEIEGQYYGIQGTAWTSPPLLAHPTSRRRVNGRTLLLFKDGTRLRFVAWKRKDGAYWVSNSLSLKLSNAQMIGIAASLTRTTT
jgi:LCP family protein required for cell wall assembly